MVESWLEAEDFKINVFLSFIACSNQNKSALARSWIYLLYNWPPNNELLLNNSLLELIYFLNTIKLNVDIDTKRLMFSAKAKVVLL